MRYLLGGLLILVGVTGCSSGNKPPDPRDRPDFVDTTDPSMVSMPALPSPKNGPPGAN